MVTLQFPIGSTCEHAIMSCDLFAIG